MTKRNVLRVFVIAVSLAVSTLFSSFAYAQEEAFDLTVENYKKAIEEATDSAEKARLHKELGEVFVSTDDLKSAAQEYLDALSLYDGFSPEERVRMAVYILWAERYDDGISVLRSILAEDPDFLEARIQLAKGLSWSGRYSEAIAEADAVLEKFPNNRDALLIKANALNWQGKPEEAIPIYEKLLKEEEEFDARLGLANAYLSLGKTDAALESSKLLQPRYAYQERALTRLNTALRRGTQPSFDALFTHYDDSDGNLVDKYSVAYGFWMYGLRADLKYIHTEARDGDFDNSADEATISLYAKPTESVGIGGGVGYGQANDGDTDGFFTWSARTDVDVLNGTLGVSISRNLFSETSELIENNIRTTTFDINLSQNLTDRWFTAVGYAYTDYSDGNHSNLARFLLRYAIHPGNPAINVGYRFRYIDFASQTGEGYFDPNDLISNQVFVSFYYENEKIFLFAQPYFGHKSFRRFGNDNDDIVAGGYGSVGIKLTENLTAEGFIEGGSSGVDSATGFDYFLVGAQLTILF
ncbi:MAG: hypothetical protein C4532_17740 [Candidatus Abyssobacteria bacterium SURF_17]|uniref:Uncharacterized protein n=1 Tax=Candidatus Abyssobacteria bacterium SURF_17 TaxID=2093361 RepID=A0A419EQ66_9BACT|nr:MAG: hypothetical protein C4532_17740 [Candidatus Abyssubacteria bacterium SURF_17]